MGEVSAQDRPGNTAEEEGQAEIEPDIAGRDRELAQHHRRHPEGERIADHNLHRPAQRQPHEHPVGNEAHDRAPERQLRHVGARRGIASAGRLAHGEVNHEAEQQPRQAHQDKGPAPVENLRQLPAEHQPCRRADRRSQRQVAHRLGQFLAREEIGDEALRGRPRTALPDAHPGAGGEQGPEPGGHAAGGGHQAPEADRAGHDILAGRAVSQPRRRKAGEHIDQRKRRSAQQAKLEVRQRKLGLDVLDQNAEHQPVSDAEGARER